MEANTYQEIQALSRLTVGKLRVLVARLACISQTSWPGAVRETVANAGRCPTGVSRRVCAR